MVSFIISSILLVLSRNSSGQIRFCVNNGNFLFYFSKTPLSPSGRGSSANAQSFSRNVPERSTFHSGMTRNRTRNPYAPGMPTSSQDTSALNSSRPSTFFSKLSSKFSKRYVNAICLCTTVWIFQDFSVIQILCEINFRESRISKTAILAHFALLESKKLISRKI